MVSLVLERELQPEKLSLVAEEVPITLKNPLIRDLIAYMLLGFIYLYRVQFLQETGDLRKKGSEVFLEGITKLVEDTLASEGSYAVSPLSTDDVLNAIDCGKSEGGCSCSHWVLDPIDGTKG